MELLSSPAAMLTFVLFLFNRKEVKVFKGSKKQEQEKGTHLQRHLKELEVFFFLVVFKLNFFRMGTCEFLANLSCFVLIFVAARGYEDGGVSRTTNQHPSAR